MPYRKPPTTKEKARKKLGDKIRKERQIKRIKRSKLERNVRQAAANEQPKKTPVLLRTEEDTASGASPRKSSGFTDRMNVDEFLESGFMKAMEDIEEGDDDDDGEEGEAEDDSSAASEEEEEEERSSAKLGRAAEAGKKMGKASQHKADLQALAKSDPEFFKYLQSTDKSLLEFDPGEDDDEDEEDEDEDDLPPKRGARK